MEKELFWGGEKYLNPLTNYGFKRIFGSETYKELLINFLNELIHDQGKIINLNYLTTEQLGQKETDRKAIFDIYCKTDCDKYFIVELQKVRQAVADISQLTTKEMEEYKKSITEYADVQDAILYYEQKGRDEGFSEGVEKGIEQEKIQIAKKCLEKGYSIETISEITGLSLEKIKNINDIL